MRNNANNLIQTSSENATDGNLTWERNIFPGARQLFYVNKKVFDKYKKYIFNGNQIFSPKTHLRKLMEPPANWEHRLLKTQIECDNCLPATASIQDRWALIKVRQSNHSLMTENLRHVKPKPAVYNQAGFSTGFSIWGWGFARQQ